MGGTLGQWGGYSGRERSVGKFNAPNPTINSLQTTESKIKYNFK